MSRLLDPSLARRFELVRSYQGGEGQTAVVRPRDQRGDDFLLKILEPGDDLHEAELLTSLEHDRVPRVLEVGRAESGRPYLLRSFVPGLSLAEVGPLDGQAAVELAVQLLEVLAFVHLRGILHLDLKPANVIVEDTHEGVRHHLVDFGLGSRRGDCGRGGTLFFAAPEQLLGLTPDERTDLFSLGATLFAAVHPPKGGLARFLRRFPRDDFFTAIGVAPSQLPAPLDRLLPRLVATRPEQRFIDAQEALEALRRGSGRPNPANLRLDPVAMHGTSIDDLLSGLTAGCDLLVRGGEAEDRRVVAMHLACRAGDADAVRIEPDCAVVSRGHVGVRELALPILKRDALAEHLREVLALDLDAASLAAHRLIEAGSGGAARVSRHLADLAARGDLVPDGFRWTWPDALSGRLALDDRCDEHPSEPDELRELAASGRIESALRGYRTASREHPDRERYSRKALVEGLLLAGEPVRALPLAHDLPILRARALLDSGRLVEARAVAAGLPPSVAGKAGDELIRLRSWLAWQGGSGDEARAALANLREPDLPENRIVRGVTATTNNDSAQEARGLLEAALVALPGESRPFLRAAALTALGELARKRGDQDSSRAHHAEALQLFRSLGNARHTATAALNLGVVEKNLGDTQAARRSLRRARALYECVEDRAGALLAEANLGIVQLEDGDARSALERFDVVRPELLAAGVHHVDGLLGALSARACAMLGDHARAAREMSTLPDPREPRIARELATARALLDADPTGEATPESDMTANDPHADAIPRAAFRTFVAVNRRIATETRLENAMRALLEGAQTLTGARAGYLLLERDGAIQLELGDTPRGGGSNTYSRSLANKAIHERRTLTSQDVVGDRDLMEMPSVRDLEVRSALCAPFRSAGGAAGALYVEHPGRAGAFGAREAEFLEILADQAAIAVDRMLHEEDLEARLERSQRDLVVATRSLEKRRRVPKMIGNSPPMKGLRRQIEKFAATALPVLIHGETGTGKELVARTLHAQSDVRGGPFVSENCSAIPSDLIESELFGHVKGAFTGAERDHAGLFELANGGSLFLDEVGDMPAAMQVKLLRVLQERIVRRVGSGDTIPINVRLITATHRDLATMIADGVFREDLYYRIAAGVIDVPPLRTRGDDVTSIARSILKSLSDEHGRTVALDEAAESRLLSYSWPGNVRELEHVLARAFLLGERDELSLEDVPRDDGDTGGTSSADWPPITIEEAITRTIRAALGATGGDKSKAARLLGISRTALYDRLKRMND